MIETSSQRSECVADLSPKVYHSGIMPTNIFNLRSLHDVHDAASGATEYRHHENCGFHLKMTINVFSSNLNF